MLVSDAPPPPLPFLGPLLSGTSAGDHGVATRNEFAYTYPSTYPAPPLPPALLGARQGALVLTTRATPAQIFPSDYADFSRRFHHGEIMIFPLGDDRCNHGNTRGRSDTTGVQLRVIETPCKGLRLSKMSEWKERGDLFSSWALRAALAVLQDDWRLRSCWQTQMSCEKGWGGGALQRNVGQF